MKTELICYISQISFQYYSDTCCFWITNRAYVSYPTQERNQSDTWEWQEAGESVQSVLTGQLERFSCFPPRASTTAVVTFPCHSQTCNSNCFHCSCHECVNTETLLRRSETLQPERKQYCICVAPKSATIDTEFMKQAKNLKVYLICTLKYIWQIMFYCHQPRSPYRLKTFSHP